jgi:hypothetical protein
MHSSYSTFLSLLGKGENGKVCRHSGHNGELPLDGSFGGLPILQIYRPVETEIDDSFQEHDRYKESTRY